eukprot:15368907-Alexandrium_andersonii.AAC.1
MKPLGVFGWADCRLVSGVRIALWETLRCGGPGDWEAMGRRGRGLWCRVLRSVFRSDACVPSAARHRA